MTAIEYKLLRKKIGSQTTVASLLEVNNNTISRREAGKQPITREAELAILRLVDLVINELPKAISQIQRKVETRPRPKKQTGAATPPPLWKKGWK